MRRLEPEIVEIAVAKLAVLIQVEVCVLREIVEVELQHAPDDGAVRA